MKIQYTCQFKSAEVSLITTVKAVDMRDAVTRFFTSDIGMLLAKSYSISVDLLQEVHANLAVHFILEQDGWVLHVDMVIAAPASNRILVLPAYSMGDIGREPEFAVVAKPADLLTEVQRLQRVAIDHSLSELRVGYYPEWGPGDIGDELRLTNGELVVSQRSFWFTDTPKGSNTSIETQGCDVADLAKALKEGGSGPIYLVGDLKGLKDRHLESVLQVLESYDDEGLVSDFYDTDQAFSQILNDCIPNFEYPDFSGMTVAEVKDRITQL